MSVISGLQSEALDLGLDLIITALFTGCVPLGKILNLSEFPPPRPVGNGYNTMALPPMPPCWEE